MSRVELVGILNVTPDSFSDGGLYDNAQAAIAHTNELFNQGASYVDVGAESTRPGAERLSDEQEWQRLQPILSQIVHTYPGHISLDTYHTGTVRRAASEVGSFIVNDVTGFNDPEMITTVADLGLTCIVSHLPEAYAQDIQAAHADRPVSSINQVHEELMSKRAKLLNAGLHSGQIILDPGIGFGKTAELNWELLEFARLVPSISVMVGYSRKRFLGENRMELEPNLQAGRIAIDAGTRFLRVHDVTGHRALLRP